MSMMTHRVRALPPGTTPERALADSLADLVLATESLISWQAAIARDGPEKLHIGERTYAEMLEDASDRCALARATALDVLYSVGRFVNPPN